MSQHPLHRSPRRATSAADAVLRQRLTPLLISMALAATFSLPAVAWSAEPAAVSRSFSIQAGPLSQALADFAAHSGVSVQADGRLVDGLQTSGLNGFYSTADGLTSLLEGSGLEAVEKSDGIYVLRITPPVPEARPHLAPVIVNALANQGDTTEGSGSYTTRSMSTATKLPLSIRETPQAVTVMTRQRMDDQGMTNLNDVAQSTPGVFLTFSGGVNRPNYSARGFAIETVMHDGQPAAVHSYIPSSQANLAMYDRVEIVRGATGLAQGAGNPSAGINLVRKRPTKDFQASITASAGSWDDFGLTGDVSGAVNEAGTLRARVVVSGKDANSFRDVEEENQGLFYATAEADLSDKTTLTLGAHRQRNYTNLIWGGLPNLADGSHLDLPRSTFIGADWEHSKSTSTGTFATLEHHLDNEWQLRANINHTASTTDVLATSVWNNHRYLWAEKMDHTETGADINVGGPLEWLGRRHELIGGVSYRRMNYTTYDYAFQSLGPVDPMNWNPRSLGKPPYTVNPERKTAITTQKSIYLAGRFNLHDSLKLILGSRADWYDYDDRHGDADYRINRNLTRYAGLLYDLDRHHTLYASYTDIFRPQTERDISRKVLQPIVGKNYEIGVKGEYLGGALNTTLALFQIDQENRARSLSDQSTCPTYPGTSCYEAAGLVRSKGIDLEIQGTLTPNWHIGAGYTYSHTKYVKDADPSKIGTTFNTTVPRQLFKLSTLYYLPGNLNKWRIGGNVNWQSRISDNDGPNWHNEQKAYAIVGVLAGYRVDDHLDLQLNIDNLFDKTYYRSISGGVWWPYDMYGTPRSVMLTARYTF